MKCIRHPLGENQRKFEARYCDGQYKQYGRCRPEVWDAKGATNLAELHDKIGDYMLRKTKEECLDLKGKARRILPVGDSVMPKGWAEYRRLIFEVQRTYEEGRKEGSAQKQEKMLGALTRVSQASSGAKVDAAVELAMAVLRDQDAVVIFTNFLRSAEALMEKFAGECWGGTRTRDKTKPTDVYG